MHVCVYLHNLKEGDDGLESEVGTLRKRWLYAWLECK